MPPLFLGRCKCHIHFMSLIRFLLICLLGALIGAWTLDRIAYADPAKLIVIDQSLRQDFSRIGHMTAEELDAHLADGAQPVFLDVRPYREFAVGHIEGAIQISPWASAKTVEKALNGVSPDRPIIFYCSVGVRSSRLAERARGRLEKSGVTNIYNLSGGVFAWHNESRPLMDVSGMTDLVHPYDRPRRKLLVHQDLISTRPRAEVRE